MITLHITTEVADDRRVVLTLPPEVPTGKAELVVTIGPPQVGQQPGVPASEIRGIAAGHGPLPDDVTLDQWVEQRRAEKYE
jgi:hypothetical protein